MTHVSQHLFHSLLGTALLVGLILFSGLLTPATAEAATVTERLETMDRSTLIKLVTALRAEQTGTYVPTTTAEPAPEVTDTGSPAVTQSNSIAFEPGARVRTTDNLRVRRSASLKAGEVGVQPRGVVGTLVQGPRNSYGYVWWKVDYDNGVDGWSVENWLRATEAAPVDYRADHSSRTINYRGGNRDDGGNNNGTQSPTSRPSRSTGGGSSSGHTISNTNPGSGVYR